MLWLIPLVSDGALTLFSFFNILVLAWINNECVRMRQIFDCATVIGWRLPSHDATVTLLVSQLRQTDIDLYRLPPKSITNPQRECQRGASGWWWLGGGVTFQLCQAVLSFVSSVFYNQKTGVWHAWGGENNTCLWLTKLSFTLLMIWHFLL